MCGLPSASQKRRNGRNARFVGAMPIRGREAGSGPAAAGWERLESELARPAPSTACEPAISQQPGSEDERDRRSKKGSKKEGKKQSGTAG